MSKKYKEYLENHDFYRKRADHSSSMISKLQEKMITDFKEYNISIFVVGSLARNEVGDNSDLDLFIISRDEILRLEQFQIYSKLIAINKELGFPEFSNDGQFLTIHKVNDLKQLAGKPDDDSLNLFTTRMLMILESKVLFNDKLYNEILSEIIEHYLRDRKGHDDFKPLFLLNDILRFWRTLCLNYEAIRHDEERPWRKKNINLKYSRLITIFSTVLSIIVNKSINHENILEICTKTPIQRLTCSLDKIDNNIYYEEYKKLLGYYKTFLEVKENESIESNIEEQEELNKNAEEFSKIIFSILNAEEIEDKLKKFLVI